MRRESFGFLKVIPIWVALMSGLFSIVREVANLYPPTQSALWDKKVFWACVWVTFVVSSLTAWLLKQHELLAEKAKNIEPKLGGRIDCSDHDVGWDVERFGVDEEGEMHLKVCFTLAVTLWNHSAAATTVSGFTLDVLWAGREFRADWLPVSNYSVKRGIPRSDFDQWGYETMSTPLTAFPDNVEITNRNHQSGWLRFLARRIPPRSADSATLHKDATL